MTGGFALSAYWAGMHFENHYFSEIEPYAVEIYQQRFPDAIPLGDITKYKEWDIEPGEYIITGGFPCVDISNAGQRAGIAAPRSGLWRQMVQTIRMVRPINVIVENVAALLGRGMGVVLGDLAEVGYDAEWDSISAANIGAPHIRDRIWISANSRRKLRNMGWRQTSGRCDDISEIGSRGETEVRGENRELSALVTGVHPRTPEDWWRAQSRMARTTPGIPGILDRLAALGRSIVPQIAELLFRQIKELL